LLGLPIVTPEGTGDPAIGDIAAGAIAAGAIDPACGATVVP
jgi:hypothetical protein